MDEGGESAESLAARWRVRGLLLLLLVVMGELPELMCICEDEDESSSVASDTVRFFPATGPWLELDGLTTFASVMTATAGDVELLQLLPFASM